jgi:hypothetical protein
VVHVRAVEHSARLVDDGAFPGLIDWLPSEHKLPPILLCCSHFISFPRSGL